MQTGQLISGAKPDFDRVFHALGDPTRRAILDKLSIRPLSISHLADPLGITLTAVAQHIQVLEDSGFVRTQKIGRVRTCSIEASGFATLDLWIKEHQSMWEHKLDRLGDLLEEV